MRLFVCEACKHAVHVGGEAEEILALLGGSTSFACITPLCGGRMLVSPISRALPGFTVVDLPIRAFFRAIHGFGSGGGIAASIQRLGELFETQKVIELRAHPIGQPERVIIEQMIFDNGTRIHFAASAKGACVYYIEEPGPSCVEVADVLDSQGADPNREEAGRDPQAAPGDVEAAEVHPHRSADPAPEQPVSGCVPGLHAADHVRGSHHPGNGDNDTDPPVRV